MTANAENEAAALEVLTQHPRAADLAAVAHCALRAMVAGKSAEPEGEAIARAAAAAGLSREDAETAYGNVLDVLQRAPNGPRERALARAVAARALASAPRGDAAAADLVAIDAAWLAWHTPFDALGLLDAVLGDGAGPLWDALARFVRRVDAEGPGALDRGEAYASAVAIAGSTSSAAARQAAALGGELQDPGIVRALAGASRRHSPARLLGELGPRPHGPVATAALGLSGISALMHLARLVGRTAFAYRKPAEVEISDDGGLRVRWRVELLGRTLRDRDVLVPRSGLVRATREVRYPRLALYAALVALVVGSYVGVTAFVDGVRAASPSLVGVGLGIVAIGLALDFVLASVLPGTRGRCTLLLTPRDLSPLCVAGVTLADADALLSLLARR